MPLESGLLAQVYVAERGSRDPSHQDQATRIFTHPSMPVPCPAPRPVKSPSQWLGPAAAATSNPPQAAEPHLYKQAVREQPAERSGAEQPQRVQEEGSRYMSTESDSDTETNVKAPRKPVSPGAAPIRDYKGQSRQMITMAFLEEGGYFDVPIQVASARLGLGVTTLKRVCRASNMKRWPFRKRNSLGRLIDRTKQVLDDGTGQDNMQKLAALQVLEKQRQVMRSCQSKDMDEKIKSYRQAIFKLDHAERKRGEAPATTLQNPLMTKLTATSAVQRILPGQERFEGQAQSSSSTDN
ncbi:hypothetical protein WJX77_008161 [Trebouxia sp. C0004]